MMADQQQQQQQQEEEDQSMQAQRNTITRLRQWVTMFIFSLTVMIGTIQVRGQAYRDNFQINERSHENWALACSIITFFTSTIVIVSEVFEGILASLNLTVKLVSGISTLVVVALCTANVSIISDPANGLAVDINGSVYFGNLYYFAWASFLTSIWISITFISSTTTIYIENTRDASDANVVSDLFKSAQRLKQWVFLMVCSLVVMGASSSIYENQCIQKNTVGRSSNYCGRTTLGIVFGCISTVISLAIILTKLTMAQTLSLFKIEAAFGVLVFVLHGFGVAFITSSYGPGAPLGNLFYFTWICFGLSFFIGSSCFEEYQAFKETREEQQHQNGGDVTQDDYQGNPPTYNLEPRQEVENEVISPNAHTIDTPSSFDDIPMEENYKPDH